MTVTTAFMINVTCEYSLPSNPQIRKAPAVYEAFVFTFYVAHNQRTVHKYNCHNSFDELFKMRDIHVPCDVPSARFLCCLSPEFCRCISHNSEFLLRTLFTAELHNAKPHGSLSHAMITDLDTHTYLLIYLLTFQFLRQVH